MNGSRPVAGEVASYTRSVDYLERKGGEQDKQMNWRHGRVEEQRRDDGTVDVMDCLHEHEYKPQLVFPADKQLRHTNNAAMSQLAGGNFSIPCLTGMVNMQ